jgi:small subunit ribosomal protein S6
VIEQAGGKVGKVENWGLKSLSYRIRKNRKAYFTLMNLDASPAAIAEVERQERINEDILRWLTVKVDAHEEGPSAMLQKRDRDERDRDGGGRGRFGDRDRGPRREFGDRPRADRPRREDGEAEAPAAAEPAGEGQE